MGGGPLGLDAFASFRAAATLDAYPGILFDTWDKSRRVAFGAEVARRRGLQLLELRN